MRVTPATKRMPLNHYQTLWILQKALVCCSSIVSANICIEGSGVLDRDLARKESKNDSILETSEQLTSKTISSIVLFLTRNIESGLKMQESFNKNNLNSLTSLMRAPSFGGPTG